MGYQIKARYFSEEKIEEFKECFHFHFHCGRLASEEDLCFIMRTLGYSPTLEECRNYFKGHVNEDGRMSFESFLEVMHDHYGAECCDAELLAALRAQDVTSSGYVDMPRVAHVLASVGERLPKAEVDKVFREAGVRSDGGGRVKIEEFVHAVLTPCPDY